MVGFPRITTPKAKQVEILLHILLARSIMDIEGVIPESLASFSCDLTFSGILLSLPSRRTQSIKLRITK